MSMNWATVSRVLNELKRAGPSVRSFGICYNFVRVVRRLYIDCTWGQCERVLERMFVELGLDSCYPVAHPTLGNEYAFSNAGGMWDDSTPYGQNRWKLLEQLIELADSKPQGELA